MDTTGKDIFVEGTQKKMSVNSYTAVKRTEMQIMGEGRGDDAGTHIYHPTIYGKTVHWVSSYDHSTTLFKNDMTELPLRGQIPNERKL